VCAWRERGKGAEGGAWAPHDTHTHTHTAARSPITRTCASPARGAGRGGRAPVRAGRGLERGRAACGRRGERGGRGERGRPHERGSRTKKNTHARPEPADTAAPRARCPAWPAGRGAGVARAPGPPLPRSRHTHAPCSGDPLASTLFSLSSFFRHAPLAQGAATTPRTKHDQPGRCQPVRRRGDGGQGVPAPGPRPRPARGKGAGAGRGRGFHDVVLHDGRRRQGGGGGHGWGGGVGGCVRLCVCTCAGPRDRHRRAHASGGGESPAPALSMQ
jgi:hypothetical protein